MLICPVTLTLLPTPSLQSTDLRDKLIEVTFRVSAFQYQALGRCNCVCRAETHVEQ